MKARVMVITFALVFTTAATQEWTRVYYHEDWGIHSTTHISQIQFINPRVGYFSTYETGMGSAARTAYLYMTTDFGRNWEKIHTVGGSTGTGGYMKFDFLDERNFFIFESKDAIYHGLLFTDSISSKHCFTPDKGYVKMINADTIVLTHYDAYAEWGNYIFLLTPGNGKLSKLQIADGYVFGYHYWLNGDIIDEVFFIKGFGAAAGNRNGLNFFYSSFSEDFDNWKKDTLNFTGKIKKLHFKDKNIGFIVCNDTILYRTQDSGISWGEVSLPGKMKINGIEFSETKGYIISTNGRVAISIDDGVTWNVSKLEGAGSFRCLATVNDFAYVVDENRQIFTNNSLPPLPPVEPPEYFVDVYPNPASNAIYVKSNMVIFGCRLYNSSGVMVMSFSPINNYTFGFRIGELSPGIYYLKFDHERGSLTKKIIKY
jgi:hypothetical protein